MKIGLITYHWVYNFGANLQCLATLKYLQKQGHEAYVINYRPLALIDKYRNSVPSMQIEAHESFCETYLNQTETCTSQQDVEAVVNEYNFDALISGSDAVLRLWRNEVYGREDTQFPNPFWLNWENSVNRKGVLAASSMGTNYFSFPKQVRHGIREALGTMDYVTVRDRWTQTILTLISRNRYKVHLSPDPVMLLNDVIDFEKETDLDLDINSPYILLSVYKNTVSDIWVEEFVQSAHQSGYQVYSLPLPESEVSLSVDKVISLPLSPLKWYTWIRRASAYVGVRFHPVVCSIANGVPFIALDKYELTPKNRYLRHFGKELTRFSSKTYDLCWRAGYKKYCLNPRQYNSLAPSQLLHLIQEQKDISSCDTRFLSSSKKQYAHAVDKIIYS